MSGFLESLANTALYVTKARFADADNPRPGLDVDIDMGEVEKKISDPGFSPADLPAYVDVLMNNSCIDDRKLLLEKALVLMSRQSDASWSDALQQQVINLLYTDLPHPPASYLSMKPPPPPNPIDSIPRPYAYRTADGSNYNPLRPNMGRANTPYARTVPGTNITPPKSLPEAGLIFDTLLRRPEDDEDPNNKHFTPHPGGISSFFFAFANLVIHSIFHTDPRDLNVNLVSSYLDLSPLYGSSKEQVDSVRRKDGKGRLWEDVFADQRLLFQPPSTCALLIMFCRNHNFIAQQLLAINENGTYVQNLSREGNEQKFDAQDEELFQRARMINCVHFMQVILGDYVGAILGLARDGYSWRLNPLKELRHLDHTISPRGEGNVCSIEFNLLYRWHATLSAEDTKWTEEEFRSIFGGDVQFDEIDPMTFRVQVGTKFASMGKDVKSWTFSGLKRNPDGRFPDDQLAKILHDATSWRAGAFKAKGIPVVMRVIEILAIEGARKWGSCSLNEFRKFIGLKPFESFEEWNPDPSVYTTAQALYHDIDNLELYVGLQAEAPKEPGPGAQLCPGYTISRAILADAVCLTRGDRFFTVECTPHNLTSWGFQDCQFDPQDGSHGGMMSKILFRNLPHHYPERSAYAYFPMLDPLWMREHLRKTGQEDIAAKYIWERPTSAMLRRKTVLLESSSHNVALLLNTVPLHGRNNNFLSVSGQRMKEITGGKVDIDSHLREIRELLATKEFMTKCADWFEKRTLELSKERSINHLGPRQVFYLDVVKDVCNALPVQWISETIAGLPLMAPDVKGSISELEMYAKFAEICSYVYLNFDLVHDYCLRERSTETFDDLTDFIKPHFKAIAGSSFRDAVTHINCQSHEFLEEVFTTLRRTDPNISISNLAARVFAEVIPTAVLFSKMLALTIDYYLDEKRAVQREELVQAARAKSTVGDRQVVDMINEALRDVPLVGNVQRISRNAVKIGSKEVNAGDYVKVALAETGDLSRFDFGSHGLMNAPLLTAVAPRILGPLLALPNIRRAPGDSGTFTSFVQPTPTGQEVMYLTCQGVASLFPEALIVQHTGTW